MTRNMIAPRDRRLPWDVMGKALNTEHASVDAALKAAGLDYEVKVQGLYAGDWDGGPLLHAPDLRAIVRPMPDGTERVLAAVGTRYTPIQNREAFSVADAMVGEFGSKITGAADFRSGASSLLVVDLNAPIRLDLPNGDTDVSDLHLYVRNAHDGSAALTFSLSAVRLACTNALHATLAGADRTWRISHTPNAAGRVDLAHQAIMAGMAYGQQLQETAQALVDQAMVDAEFAKIVANLFPVAEGKGETRAGRRALEVRDEIVDLYRTSPTLEGARGTLWGGYNAITEWMDWGRNVKGDEAVTRAEAQVDLANPYARRSARVWDLFASAVA